VKIQQELAVLIIYLLLWSEYDYRHALEYIKKRKPLFSWRRIFSLYSQQHLTFFMKFRIALWSLYSSYSNNVMMGTEN